MIVGSGIAGILLGVVAIAMFFIRMLHRHLQQRNQHRQNRAENMGLPSVHNTESSQEQNYHRSSRVDSIIIQNESKFENFIRKCYIQLALK